MVKIFIKYFISLVILSSIGVFILDNIILPNFVGLDNEIYLPDVRDEYVEKASYKLNSLGFNTEIIISKYDNNYIPGIVILMFPRAFTKVKKGRTINLTVSGEEKDVEIPNIINLSLRNAKIEIGKLGLGIDTIIHEFDNSIKEGYITFQVPKPGLISKTSINLTFGVSKGAPPDYYIVPDIVNLSLGSAKQKILNAGLRIGNINYEYQPHLLNNTVIEQSMTSGMRVSFPLSINILASKDSVIKQ